MPTLEPFKVEMVEKLDETVEGKEDMVQQEHHKYIKKHIKKECV